jgi:hypothetical protein
LDVEEVLDVDELCVVEDDDVCPPSVDGGGGLLLLLLPHPYQTSDPAAATT